MAFTARVVDPGGYYENRRNHQMTRVPATHHAVVCDACAYAVHVPCRQGRDRAEQLRRDHLLSAHITQLSSGAVVLTEIPPTFALSEPPSCAARSAVGRGSLNGTVEQDVPSVAEVPDSAIAPGLDGPLIESGRHFARAG